MKVLRLLAFFLVFFLCLFTGIKMGSKLSQKSAGVVEIQNTPRVFDVFRGGNQRNILIIGTKQIDNPNSQLEGLWLLIYYRDTTKIDFIPIFPSIREEDILRNQLLAGAFSIDTNGEPSQNFWDYLSTRDILWHNYVFLDEAALKAISNLAGIYSANDGSQFVSWTEDTATALRNQSTYIDKLCDQFIAGNFPEDLTTFVTHLTPHLITDFTTNQINSEWQLFLTNRSDIACKFPTLSP